MGTCWGFRVARWRSYLFWRLGFGIMYGLLSLHRWLRLREGRGWWRGFFLSWGLRWLRFDCWSWCFVFGDMLMRGRLRNRRRRWHFLCSAQRRLSLYRLRLSWNFSFSLRLLFLNNYLLFLAYRWWWRIVKVFSRGWGRSYILLAISLILVR